MKNRRTLYIYSSGVILLFVMTFACLDRFGKRCRVFGYAGPLTDSHINRIVVDDPAEAFTYWQNKKFRGRMVISLSRRLHFFIDESRTPLMPFPIKVFNLSQEAARVLNGNNFLYVASKTGLARETIHIVNDSQFAEKLRQVKEVEGAQVRRNGISAPLYGSPRLITTLTYLQPSNEPVLLHINASFFRECEPQALLQQLLKSGVTADAIVLSKSLHDGEVTAIERERLEAFARLLGIGNGKN